MKPYYETELGKLYHGDCLDIMPTLEPVDLVLTDPPYGTTQNKWDIVVPLDKMWRAIKAKESAAIILFGQDKFTASVMLSCKHHRYNLIWDKGLTSGFLNANKMPLRVHEDIMVFYKKLPTYNPQKIKGKKSHSKGTMATEKNRNYGVYGKVDNTDLLGDMKHPKSIYFSIKTHPSKCVHPTQKPVVLMEYLIKTYTNKKEVVLDFAIGSGTTAVACERLSRRWIGIEIEEKYCELAAKRIENERKQLKLF